MEVCTRKALQTKGKQTTQTTQTLSLDKTLRESRQCGAVLMNLSMYYGIPQEEGVRCCMKVAHVVKPRVCYFVPDQYGKEENGNAIDQTGAHG